MNEHDLQAREIVRRARPPMSGNRTLARNSGAGSVPPAVSGTRLDGDGNVRRLFLIDISPMDNAAYYLGDGPLERT